MKRGFSLDDLSATTSGDCSGSAMGKKRSKTGHNKGKATASQPTTSKHNDTSSGIIDEAINDVLSQSASQHSHRGAVLQPEGVDGSILSDTSVIQLLFEKIEKQQTIIENLERKLDSVLSFMGISHAAVDTVTGNTNSENNALEHESQDMDVVTTDSTSSSYATVASRVPVSATASVQPRSLSDAVVTAFYREQLSKDRRSKSVIVNGFLESSAGSDRERFTQLCSTELQVDPNVVYVKRIGSGTSQGQGHGQGQGRPRPLLVAVRTSDEAATLVERSKAVDRSTADQGMRSVYINPNLSKAESKAAYEERCRRRSAAQRRGGSHLPSSSGQQSRSVNNNHVFQGDADRPEAAAAAGMSLLNPTASEFTAVGSHGTQSGT